MRRNSKFENKLRDDQWAKLKSILPEVIIKNYRRANVRLFIDSVLWVTVNNTAWIYLPEEYAHPGTTYNRFRRWSELKIWHSLVQKLADDDELRTLLVSVVERSDIFVKTKENRKSNAVKK